jgi:hypothetical protein
MPLPAKPALLVDPPETGTGHYPYFDRLSARPDCLASYSLRDQEQLLEYRHGPGRPPDVNYDPTVDAARIIIKADQVSLDNGVILPIPEHAPGSLFATWDVWMAKEFAYELTGIGNYKHFNFLSPDRIWTEPKADWDSPRRNGQLAEVYARYYGSKNLGQWGPNVTHNNPITPYNSWAMRAETWIRYWFFFEPTTLPARITYRDGTVHDHTWWAFSWWAHHQGETSRHRIYDRVLIVPNYPAATGWHKLNIEYNTSTTRPSPTLPERHSLIRNVVFLKGVTDPATVMETIH